MKNRTFMTVLFFIVLSSSGHASGTERLILTALDSMQRVAQDQKVDGAGTVKISSARNEVESFQVVISAPKENINVTKVEIFDLIGTGGSKIEKDNIKLFREEFVRVRMSSPRAELPPGLYPDPLVPFINPVTNKPIEPLSRTRARWGEAVTTSGYDMYALPFEVFKGQNQVIWIDVYVPKNTPAGQYNGRLRVLAKGGISEQIPITVTVWDFTLPDGPTHRNHFGSFGMLRGILISSEIQTDSNKSRCVIVRRCPSIV